MIANGYARLLKPRTAGETISNAAARRYVKGGHNYVTASLNRILFDYLPRDRSVGRDVRGGGGKDGWGEAKFTGSVCRETTIGGRVRAVAGEPLLLEREELGNKERCRETFARALDAVVRPGW